MEIEQLKNQMVLFQNQVKTGDDFIAVLQNRNNTLSKELEDLFRQKQQLEILVQNTRTLQDKLQNAENATTQLRNDNERILREYKDKSKQYDDAKLKIAKLEP